MRKLVGLVAFGWLLALWPAVAWACVYPTPVRVANAVLLEVLNGTGQVNTHQRNRLERAMAQLDPATLRTALAAELSRREARAVNAVVDAAATLARGVGRTVDEDLRGPVMQVHDGVQSACAADNAADSGASDAANGAERGTGRNEGAGGRALTFGEGVVRLSLTFVIYMVFLAFLLVLRRTLKARQADAMTLGDVPEAAVPGAPHSLHPSDGTPTPADPAGARPRPR